MATPSSDSILFEYLNRCQEPSDDFKELSQGVCSAYRIIEPWRQARSEDPGLKGIITKMVYQADQYTAAVGASVGVAQQGRIFAEEGMDLCRFLRAEKRPPKAQLKRFLENMRTCATKAHNSGTEMLAQFRTVRIGIMQISKRIPKETLESVHSIVLPTPIPDNVDDEDIRGMTLNQARSTEEETVQELVDKLRALAKDLEVLGRHVSTFVHWWETMEGDLMVLDKKIQGLTPITGRELQGEIVQEKWKLMKERYVMYGKQISTVQDYYYIPLQAPPRPPAPESGAKHATPGLFQRFRPLHKASSMPNIKTGHNLINHAVVAAIGVAAAPVYVAPMAKEREGIARRVLHRLGEHFW